MGEAVEIAAALLSADILFAQVLIRSLLKAFMCLTHQTPVFIFNFCLTSLPCNDIWKHVLSLNVFVHKRNDLHQKVLLKTFLFYKTSFTKTALYFVTKLVPCLFDIFPGFLYPSF